ncbi:Leucine-rich repeat (LRR) protein [Balamuthia mandrillaris]
MGGNVSKAIEVAKTKGGTHFALIEGKKKERSEKEIEKLLQNITGQLPKLSRVTITACHLNSLPQEGLERFQGLVALTLTENELRDLPEGMKHLTSLQELHLTKNRLTAVPPPLRYLSALQQLSLDYNYLGGEALLEEALASGSSPGDPGHKRTSSNSGGSPRSAAANAFGSFRKKSSGGSGGGGSNKKDKKEKKEKEEEKRRRGETVGVIKGREYYANKQQLAEEGRKRHSTSSMGHGSPPPGVGASVVGAVLDQPLLLSLAFQSSPPHSSSTTGSSNSSSPRYTPPASPVGLGAVITAAGGGNKDKDGGKKEKKDKGKKEKKNKDKGTKRSKKQPVDTKPTRHSHSEAMESGFKDPRRIPSGAFVLPPLPAHRPGSSNERLSSPPYPLSPPASPSSGSSISPSSPPSPFQPPVQAASPPSPRSLQSGSARGPTRPARGPAPTPPNTRFRPAISLLNHNNDGSHRHYVAAAAEQTTSNQMQSGGDESSEAGSLLTLKRLSGSGSNIPMGQDEVERLERERRREEMRRRSESLEMMSALSGAGGSLAFGHQLQQSMQFPKMTALTLAHNGLKQFPSELDLASMTMLEKLSLAGNELSALPAGIGSLYSLTSLSLVDNCVATLPDQELAGLSQLNELLLQRNELSSLPPAALANLVVLKNLDLTSNSITSLPPSIGGMTALKALLLGHNRLTELPEEFGNLVNLVTLKLNDNALTSLPASIGNLVNLNEFYLGNNELEELPPSFGNLTNLHKLHLENNRLSGLPSEFKRLNQLQVVALDGNQLKEVPLPLIFLKLYRLKLGGNPLESDTKQYISKHGDLALIRQAQKILSKEHAPSKPPPYIEWKLAFELLLDQMDIPMEKKLSMMKLDNDKKWLLLLQSKGAGLVDLSAPRPLDLARGTIGKHSAEAIGDSASAGAVNSDDPAFFVEALSTNAPSLKQITTLRVSLTSKPVTWIMKFADSGGAQVVLSQLSNVLQQSGQQAEALRENLLNCYKALWKVRLKSLTEQLVTAEAIKLLTLNLDCQNLRVVKLAIEILARLCEARPEHSKLVLDAFSYYKEAHGEEKRFETLFSTLSVESAQYQVVLLPLRISCLALINALLSNCEELEERFFLRNEFLVMGLMAVFKDLREIELEELELQLNTFEEDMTDDNEAMFNLFGPEKLLEKMGEFKEALGLGNNFLMVMISSSQAINLEFLSYDLKETTVADIIHDIVRRFPKGKFRNIADYGLHLHPMGVCLEEQRSLCSYQLSGPLICQFKMKNWLLPVRFRINRADVSEYMLSFDPNATCSETIIQLIKQKPGALKSKHASGNKSLANATDKVKDKEKEVEEDVKEESYEEYGLYLVSPDQSSAALPPRGSVIQRRPTIAAAAESGSSNASSNGQQGTWLEATKTLAFYELNHRQAVLELRLKPKPIKVKFLDNTFQQLQVDPYCLVREMLEEIGNKLGLSAENLEKYGLYLENSNKEKEEGEKKEKKKEADKTANPPHTGKVARKDAGQWLNPDAELQSYDIQHQMGVRFMLKPQKVTVAVALEPGQGGKAPTELRRQTFEVDYTQSVESITNTLCQQLGFSSGLSAAGRLNFSLILQGQDSEEAIALDPKLALRQQVKRVNRQSVLLLRPSEGNKINQTNGGSNRNVLAGEQKQTQTQSPSVLSRSNLASASSDPRTLNIYDPKGSTGTRYKEGTTDKIEYGSLNRLVVQLTSSTYYDKNFLDTFFFTYKTFCMPKELLQKLKERFEVPDSVPEMERHLIKMRVFDVLRIWIENYYEDLKDLISPLKSFIQVTMKQDSSLDPVISERLTQCLERAASGTTLVPTKLLKRGDSMTSKHGIPKLISHDSITIFDLEEDAMAQQLCLMEWKAFSRIQPLEFFKQSWSKPKTQALCPNLMAMIESFNFISTGVAGLIVKEKKVRNRRALMWKLINVAKALREYNNFHTLMAFLSAFNNSAVLRLKWTRERLPGPAKKFLEETEALMSMEGSYKDYRAALEQAIPPCIPYIGVCLSDLTFIEDGNPDEAGNGLINFYKRELIYKIISMVKNMQATAYDFGSLPEIANLFKAMPQLDDKELYALSLQREPRNAKKSDIL